MTETPKPNPSPTPASTPKQMKAAVARWKSAMDAAPDGSPGKTAAAAEYEKARNAYGAYLKEWDLNGK